MNIYVVGDLHGERLRFTHVGYGIKGNLKEGDFLIVCGDFGFVFLADEKEQNIFHPHHPEERKLSFFLEWVRENTEYKHWYAGHLHRDEDIWRHQTLLHYDVRNLLTNIPVENVEREDSY